MSTENQVNRGAGVDQQPRAPHPEIVGGSDPQGWLAGGQTSVTTTAKRQRVRAGDGDTVSVTLQLPKQLHDAVKKDAEEDERSIPHFIVRYLRDTYPADSK